MFHPPPPYRAVLQVANALSSTGAKRRLLLCVCEPLPRYVSTTVQGGPKVAEKVAKVIASSRCVIFFYYFAKNVGNINGDHVKPLVVF